ncbi:MAG: hypothetical protein K6357_05595 [Elusimicrobiota bacterium]
MLSPEYKIPTKPDPEGINYTEFSYDKETKKYTFKLNDKWANEYAGEKVAIKIELMKSVANWFDSSMGEKEFIFDVSNSYEIVFGEKDLVKPQTDNEATRNEKLFETKGYYLKWGFKRIGSISTDKFIKKGDTPIININSKGLAEVYFPNMRKVKFAYPPYSFGDCWEGNEVVGELICRLVCCLASPDNMHHPTKPGVTCYRDCKDEYNNK